MPLHVVIAHIAVIVAPLTALVALVYAVRPKARRALRWPLFLVWWLLRPGRSQTVWTVVAAVLLGLSAIATLVTTGVVLDQAMAAVWSQHPLYT